ncbi:hypothetical protein [Streptomyces sp. OS603R]|uniref:hypothetical protein n=1 Tax=Streptomyces sp. OS603R TaxID=3035287 RepID=UPI00243553C8|nr:hypothetical protein [Streptomyces sp. OS603R]
MSTRESTAHRRAVAQRDALLRAMLGPVLCTAPGELRVLNPYWGDLGARFAWNNASFPPGGVEAFGGDVPEDLAALLIELFENAVPEPNQVVTALARHAPCEAVDLLWMLATERATAQEADVLAGMGAEAAALAERAAMGQASNWPADAADDDEFLVRLMGELTVGRAETVPTQETFGGRPGGRRMAVLRLREALGRLTMAAPRGGASAVRLAVRRPAHAAGTQFIGDVLAYFRQREELGAGAPIAVRVADALDEGARLRSSADPWLVVIAHSMGGNIVYDLLSYLRPDLGCDVLVTVGSQVGLFAELGQFPALPAPEDPAHDRAPVPEGVRNWINVFDPVDILSFVISPIFAAGEDYRYSTGRGLLAAHSSYFRLPSFHRRLAERIAALLPAERHV